MFGRRKMTSVKKYDEFSVEIDVTSPIPRSLLYSHKYTIQKLLQITLNSSISLFLLTTHPATHPAPVLRDAPVSYTRNQN